MNQTSFYGTSKNLYYNAVFNNTATFSTDASFTDARTNPFIPFPRDYYLEITRFTIQANNIPLFFFSQEGPFWVTIQSIASNISYAQQVVHTPQNYLFSDGVFNVQNFLDDINLALKFALIAAQVGEAWPATYLNNPPTLIWNPSINAFQFLVRTDLFSPGNNTATPVALLYFNTNLFNKFCQLNAKVEGENQASLPQPNNAYRDVQIIVSNQDGTTNQIATLWCGSNVLSSWVTMTRVVFTSANLPIEPENIYIPSGKAATLPIIADFEPDFNGPTTTIDTIQYFQTGAHKYLDLIGTNPINTIDVSCMWVDRLGNYYKIQIPPGGFFSLKLHLANKTKQTLDMNSRTN